MMLFLQDPMPNILPIQNRYAHNPPNPIPNVPAKKAARPREVHPDGFLLGLFHSIFLPWLMMKQQDKVHKTRKLSGDELPLNRSVRIH